MKKSGLYFAFLGMFLTSPATAASLWVYSLNISALPSVSYVTAPPYVSWPASVIQANPNNWVSAEQLLVLQTDMPNDPKHQGSVNWGIQIFTDNTWVGNATTIFNIPDSTFSGTIQGPLSRQYGGLQTIFDKTKNKVKLPKGGLVSESGETLLPLIWRIYDGIPPGNRVQPVVQNPNAPDPGCSPTPVSCDFCDCGWFFMRDKGDQYLLSAGGLPLTDWIPNDWYQVPWNAEGLLTTVCRPEDWAAGRCGKTCKSPDCVNARFPPTPIPSQPYQAYLYLATNFRNATRQMYSTTIFVELYVL